MAFEELKQRQSVMWGYGSFERLSDTAGEIYDALVAAVPPMAGERWLDVACGTGAISERAARGGADVVGIDLAPGLIETAKRLAAERGLDIDYRVGDAENLDVGDGSFDTISSSFGVMFAPDQARAAGELARVIPPGGRLALLTWTPEGGMGEMFRFSAPYQPPPAEGAGNPLDWGRPEHVEGLLGDAFELSFEQGTSTFRVDSAEDYWQLLAANLGPMKTLLESMDDERRDEYHGAWVEFADATWGADGCVEQPRGYLITAGTRR